MYPFSVVTMSRNRPEHLALHLSSLKNQNVKEKFQLIILDDSSPDDSRQEEIIKTFDCPCADVLAYRMLNRVETGFVGRTLNFGLQKTDSDFIFVLCADDILPYRHLAATFWTYRMIREAEVQKLVLGWPLYHFRPTIAIQGDCIDLPLEHPEWLLRREEIVSSWASGLDVWWRDIIDDRALYSREFLWAIKGWPECGGNWWRDGMMRRLIENNGYTRLVHWASFSIHVWHMRDPSPHDQTSLDWYNTMTSETKVSNVGSWGDAEAREIGVRRICREPKYYPNLCR